MKKLIFTVLLFCTPFAYATFDGHYTFSLESATQLEINSISSPQNGTMVYNTDDNKVYYYNGSSWVSTVTSNIYNTNGQLSGNREVDLNSQNLGFMNGSVGIADVTPDATLDVAGSFRLDGIYYDKDGDAGIVGQILTSTATGTDWAGTTSVPYISSGLENMLISSTKTFTITGNNFLPISIVTIPGFDGTIDSVNIVSPTQIDITVTSGAATDDYDIIITNNGVSNTSWAGNGDDLLHVGPEINYLYAITSSLQCAEQLPYGPDHIVEADNAYFSTEYRDILHNKMLQVFTVGGVELYRITYNFTTTKTLRDRMSDAVNGGETVNWVVQQGANTFNYGPFLWYYSDGANITSGSAKWTGSGTNWSNDDGSWGAAPNNIDGNGGPYETWGHGNHNGGDSQCRNYYTNGASNTSNTIKSFMYMIVP